MRAARPRTDSAKRPGLKPLDLLRRTAPITAVQTRWAVAHRYDSCSVAALREGELANCSLGNALEDEPEGFGLPEEVRDYVFVGGPSKARAQELGQRQLARLDKRSMPPLSCCFEAMAGLAIRSDEGVLALVGLPLRSAGDAIVTLDGPYHEGKRTARKRIETLAPPSAYPRRPRTPPAAARGPAPASRPCR